MNFAIVSAYCANTFRRLRDEEEGLALTEYLLLLGLMVGGVIAAVGAFGGALSSGWTDWGGWAGATISDPWADNFTDPGTTAPTGTTAGGGT
ncbi:hypothetical protein [Alloyangia pacifica]|uniref:hypothetical protein n=1 Tax=Alloyangia pacifica TaxID=311180 RepID=UPI001CD4F6B4|nr:hypothetical protein [Alloyangia pacifica]MCA0997994.1 hypothetical protein [Alloyangia pacifica]